MVFSEWTKAFEVQVPELVEDACRDIVKGWSNYVVEIGINIKGTAPNLAGPFSEIFSELQSISGEFCHNVKREIDAMIDKARTTQEIFGNSIKSDLAPIFEAALEEKGELAYTYL